MKIEWVATPTEDWDYQAEVKGFFVTIIVEEDHYGARRYWPVIAWPASDYWMEDEGEKGLGSFPSLTDAAAAVRDWITQTLAAEQAETEAAYQDWLASQES